MKNAIISLFLLFIAVQYVAAQKKVNKIACIGNSITYGVGTRNPAKDSYPAVLGQMLGDGYGTALHFRRSFIMLITL